MHSKTLTCYNTGVNHCISSNKRTIHIGTLRRFYPSCSKSQMTALWVCAGVVTNCRWFVCLAAATSQTLLWLPSASTANGSSKAFFICTQTSTHTPTQSHSLTSHVFSSGSWRLLAAHMWLMLVLLFLPEWVIAQTPQNNPGFGEHALSWMTSLMWQDS